MSTKPELPETEKKLVATFSSARGIPGRFERELIELQEAIQNVRDGADIDLVKEQMMIISRKFPNHPNVAPIFQKILENNFNSSHRAYLCADVICSTVSGSVLKSILASVGIKAVQETLSKPEKNMGKQADRHYKALWDVSDILKGTDIGSATELEAGTYMLSILPDAWKLRDHLTNDDWLDGIDFLEKTALRVAENPHGPLKNLLVETTDKIAQLFLEEVAAGSPIKPKKQRAVVAPTPSADPQG